MTARDRKGGTRQTRTVTTGTTIRMEQPSSKRGSKPKVQTVIVTAPDQFVGGFIDFIREHAVVGLAIGFIIGVQAQALVRQLVDSFISPAFTLLFGQALAARNFTIEWNDRTANFGWGAFAYGLLNFLFVLAAIYALFKFLKLDKLDKVKEDKK